MSNLGENQKAVLRKAVKEKRTAKVTFQTAKSVYGDKHGAKKCLTSLSSKGILEEVKKGHIYRITNLPEELHHKWLK